MITLSKLRLLFTIILFQAFFVFLVGQKVPDLPSYDLKIHIDPSLNKIVGRCEIRNPQDSCFLLTKNLKIQRITADGKTALFRQKPSDSSEFSREIIIKAAQLHNLVFEYSGQLDPDSFPKMISMMNMIKPGLVELSDKFDWYPRMVKNVSFRYKLDVDIPINYVTVANGLLLKQQMKNNRNLTEWKSSELKSGITFISAPDFRKAEIIKDGITVEIYYTKLPRTYIDSMKTSLLKATELLTGLFGSGGGARLIRIVYSPRSANGYCREPLIIVSENYALTQRGQEFGYARDFRLNTHEIAHYWSMADSDSPDEWINEGLAEFSALLVSEKVIGRNFYDLLLKEYKEQVSNSHVTGAIAEKSALVLEREVNLYIKPSLLLNDLYQKYGYEKMSLFLKDLYTRFSEIRSANTAIFLEVLEKEYGKDQKDSFSQAIYRKQSNATGSLAYKNSSSSDTTFIGTWAGPLTQFGSTLKFVLNIRIDEGKLIPTVDSPDQDVMNIPVDELKIAEDSLSFKLCMVSARFSGHLNDDSLIINGEWTQKGMTYPLVLSKVSSVE